MKTDRPPETVRDYLDALRSALKGASPGLISDALADAEEHLQGVILQLDDGEVVTVGLDPLDIGPRPDQQQCVASLERLVEQVALVGNDAAPQADHGQSEAGAEFSFNQRLPGVCPFQSHSKIAK